VLGTEFNLKYKYIESCEVPLVHTRGTALLQVLGVLMQCPRIPVWIAQHHRYTTAGRQAAAVEAAAVTAAAGKKAGQKARRTLLPLLLPPAYMWGLLAPPPLARFVQGAPSALKRKAERQEGREVAAGGAGALQAQPPRFAMVQAGPVLPAPAAASPADQVQQDLDLSMDQWDLTDLVGFSQSELNLFDLM